MTLQLSLGSDLSGLQLGGGRIGSLEAKIRVWVTSWEHPLRMHVETHVKPRMQ